MNIEEKSTIESQIKDIQLKLNGTDEAMEVSSK